MPASFRSLLSARLSDWADYYNCAWRQAGQPEQLELGRLFHDPVTYSADIYRWSEAKYNHDFAHVFRMVRVAIRDIHVIEDEFIKYWHLYFDPWSLWKQIRPLFAFSYALGGSTEAHRRLAAAYVVAQGVPSKAVDTVLDTPDYPEPKSHLAQLTAFCLVAYSIGLRLLRMADLDGRVEEALLNYSHLMYSYMWKESAQRYVIPDPTPEELNRYINGHSRLLSSVFYGLNIEWAFTLAGRSLDTTGKQACTSFRRVRQLNDELIDVEEDIRKGVLTYPMLHCLGTARHGNQMKQLLETAWSGSDCPKGVPDELLGQLRQAMSASNSFYATAKQSFALLQKVMKFVEAHFSPSDAFDVCLMINQRVSTLLKRSDSGWTYVPDNYHPQLLFMPEITELITQ